MSVHLCLYVCVAICCLSVFLSVCLYAKFLPLLLTCVFFASPVLVVARIDGTLDFLTLLDPVIPTRSNISPFKRSSPKSQRKTTTDHPVDVSPMQAHALPLCSLTHRVRAHHQPASVMVVTKERVVTGSRDRTLKVRMSLIGLFAFSFRRVSCSRQDHKLSHKCIFFQSVFILRLQKSV